MLNFSVLAACALLQPSAQPYFGQAKELANLLAAESGQKVQLPTGLGRDLVFMDRNGASSAVALSSLASALHSSVLPSKDGLVIERTQEDVAAYHKQRLTIRLGWISAKVKSIEEFRASRHASEVAGAAVLSEIANESSTAELVSRGKVESFGSHYACELLPTETLILSVMEKIGASTLAGVPSGKTQVWEDHPVGGALPLPDESDAMSRWIEQFNRMSQPPLPAASQIGIGRLGMTNTFKGWGEPRKLPAKLRFWARAEDQIISFFLEGFDQDGRQLLFAMVRACPHDSPQFPGAIAKPFLATPAEAVPLSSAEEAALAFRRVNRLEDLPVWFKDPVANDPMKQFVTPYLEQLARQDSKKCFVAEVPDTLYDDVRASCSDHAVNLAAFQATMRDWSQLEEIQSPTSTIWRTCQSPDACSEQANRNALKALTKSVVSSKAVELRSMAKFCYDAGERQTAFCSFWAWALHSSPQISHNDGGCGNDFYRALGAISDQDWSELISGTPKVISTLGVSTVVNQMIEDEYEPVKSIGEIPDLFKHPSELFEASTVGEVKLSFIYREAPFSGVSYARDPQRIDWSEAELPNLIRFVDLRLAPVLKVATSREQFDDYLANSGATLYRAVKQILTARFQLPQGLYFEQRFDGAIHRLGGPVAYGDLSPDQKDQLFDRTCTTALTHIHIATANRHSFGASAAKP